MCGLLVCGAHPIILCERARGRAGAVCLCVQLLLIVAYLGLSLGVYGFSMEKWGAAKAIYFGIVSGRQQPHCYRKQGCGRSLMVEATLIPQAGLGDGR
jgi:hypothetical protein